MKKALARLIGACVFLWALASQGQHLGTPSLPEDLPKTCILIETAKTVHNEAYIPIVGMNLPANMLTNGSQVLDSKLYGRVQQDTTNYNPIGSGVLVRFSNVVFLATADHVIATNPEVSFRIPQNTGAPPKHISHKEIFDRYACDWVRDTDSDIAIIPFVPGENDDIKAISVESFLAGYDDIKIGDEVYVLGFPSSVLVSADPSVHFVRNGIVASKLASPRIVLDAFVFPGNSGGPV